MVTLPIKWEIVAEKIVKAVIKPTVIFVTKSGGHGVGEKVIRGDLVSYHQFVLAEKKRPSVIAIQNVKKVILEKGDYVWGLVQKVIRILK